ncbi:hypothetical protein MINTM020_01340 [Mycobacterium paraintracellulare]|nr:hypothetical protein MINTM020_01340 [Mycobacterium paraintracellulare]
MREVIGKLFDAVAAHRRLTRPAVAAVVVTYEPDFAGVPPQQVLDLAGPRDLAQTKPVQEDDGAIGVSRAAVARGKPHTVTRCHPMVFLSPTLLDAVVTCWPVIFEGSGVVMLSDCEIGQRLSQRALVNPYLDSHCLQLRGQRADPATNGLRGLIANPEGVNHPT